MNLDLWLTRAVRAAACLSSVLAFLLSSPTAAQFVPTTVTLTSGQDTQLSRLAADVSAGSSTTLLVDGFFKPEIGRVLIRFDQTAINNAIGTRQLSRARLVLKQSRPADAWAESLVDIFRLTKSWSQATATWNSMFLLGEPFDTVNPTARVTIPNLSAGTVEFDVTKDVAAFTNGTPNNGWVIKDDGWLNGVSTAFHSFEASVNRPQLIVESTSAAPVGTSMLQFPTPGAIVVSAQNGAEILEIPERGRSFATERDMHVWMVNNLNARMDYDSSGRTIGVIGESTQIGDLFYIDTATGQSVPIEDVVTAIVGGKDGIITVAGVSYCIREEGCGSALKAPPEVDRQCQTLSTEYCAKGTSWKTTPISRLFIYSSIGTKVEQKEGGYHRDCGFCWKAKIFPWRCCNSRGSNQLILTNGYQSSEDRNGLVGFASRVVDKTNVTQIKHRLYATFTAKIRIKTDTGEIGPSAAVAGGTVAGVCGTASARATGSSGSARVRMQTSAGTVDRLCPDVEVPPQ